MDTAHFDEQRRWGICMLYFQDIMVLGGLDVQYFSFCFFCCFGQRELIDPAVQGTMNVLKASHAAKVRRVVVTSSVSAMFPNPKLPPGTAVDENSWTDIEYCKEKGVSKLPRICVQL